MQRYFYLKMKKMENPPVQVVQVEPAITAVGKTFMGDYSASPKYASEVQNLLSAASIPFIPNKVIGVYYDNPETTPAEELRCFQGFLVENEPPFIDPPLSRLALAGKYLYTKVTGDPAKIIFDGYRRIIRPHSGKGSCLKIQCRLPGFNG